MAFYIVTGKLGSGKSLMSVSRIKEKLLQGCKVATNLDIYVDKLLPPDSKNVSLIRLPDLPSIDDFNAIGYGSDVVADESKFGLVVLDEGSGNFNARNWNDKNRLPMIDWLKHSRKYRWDVIIIVQNENMLDKQIRESFGEHLVVCKRTDRLSIPFVGFLSSLITGYRVRPPKIHVGIVRYGLERNSTIVDTWKCFGNSLYFAYDTEQIFTVDYSNAIYSYLPPYHLSGRYMDKFKLARLIAGSSIFVSFFAGCIVSLVVCWWLWKGSENSLLTKGSAVKTQFSIEESNNQKSLIDDLYIDGYASIDDGLKVFLSNGEVLFVKDYDRTNNGISIRYNNRKITTRSSL